MNYYTENRKFVESFNQKLSKFNFSADEKMAN